MYKPVKIKQYFIYNFTSIVLQFFLLQLIFNSQGNCQKNSDIYQNVSDYKGNSVFYIAKKIPNIDFNLLVDYYWFSDNEIHVTKGAIGGKPLNGSFIKYYLDNNLKEKGEFYYGAKVNAWKYWHINGNIHKIENYDKGLLDGKYYVYNDKTQLIVNGQYKKNLKYGIWKLYDNNGCQLNFYTWRKGLLNGKFEIYDSTKTIIGSYKYGKLDGKYILKTKQKKDIIIYYDNGVERVSKSVIKNDNVMKKSEKQSSPISKDSTSQIQKKEPTLKTNDKTKKEQDIKNTNQKKENKADKDVKTKEKKSFFSFLKKKSKNKDKKLVPENKSGTK